MKIYFLILVSLFIAIIINGCKGDDKEAWNKADTRTQEKLKNCPKNEEVVYLAFYQNAVPEKVADKFKVKEISKGDKFAYYRSNLESAIKVAKQKEVIKIVAFGTGKAYDKINLSLRRKITNALENDKLAEGQLEAIGKSQNPLTQENEDKLNSIGIKVGSITGNTFTMYGTPSAMLESAELNFITNLEGSREDKPMGR